MKFRLPLCRLFLARFRFPLACLKNGRRDKKKDGGEGIAQNKALQGQSSQHAMIYGLLSAGDARLTGWLGSARLNYTTLRLRERLLHALACVGYGLLSCFLTSSFFFFLFSLANPARFNVCFFLFGFFFLFFSRPPPMHQEQ